MRRAFTLLELLTCVGIIVLLTALLTPVFAAARRQSQVAASVNNLRQMHLVVEMYRQSSGAEDGPTLGLPSLFDVNRKLFPRGLEKSPCGWNPGFSASESWFHYLYWPGFLEPDDLKSLRHYGDQMILITDPHCDFPGVPIDSPKFEHLGIGVRLDGTVVRRTAKGDPSQLEWWVF